MSMMESGRMCPAVDKAGAKACVTKPSRMELGEPILQIRVHLKTWSPNLLIATLHAQIGWVGVG